MLCATAVFNESGFLTFQENECILRYIMDSQESLKVGDSIWDFDWDLNRSVEFRSPFTRKEILSPGSNSSNSSMIDNQRRNEIKKSS